MSEEFYCTLCPRNCNAKREKESGDGFCRMGTLPKVARAALHFWEEPCISGTKGSGAIFFSGCTLACVFCQNYEISQKDFGKVLSAQSLATLYQRLEQKGAHNINLVNPTHFVPAILESFSLYRPQIPVVYNTGGYDKLETLRRLEGYVDIYLPDFKYIDGQLAARFSGAKNYVETVTVALQEMVRQTGCPQFDDDGILQSGTVIRHLLLPGHTKDAMAIIDWVQSAIGEKRALFSLMGQYLPCGKADKVPELCRCVTKREYEKVERYLMDSGLEGFVQELDSAQKQYIPSFQLEGLETC